MTHPPSAELMIKIRPILEALAPGLRQAGQEMLTLCPAAGFNHSPSDWHYLHINARVGFPAPLFGRRRETGPPT